MPQYEETRCEAVQGLSERASNVFPGRIIEEDSPSESTLQQQCAWLAARYSMGPAHARALAEAVFARTPQR